jgi:alpha(1,3/1,4) fucosyltransferase
VPADGAEVVFCGEGIDGRLFKKAITFFVPVELWWPKLDSFDYGLGFLYLRHPRYFRLPCYACEFRAEQLVKPADFVDRFMAEEREFCSFLVANANPRRTIVRLNFFHLLNSKKRVDSGGAAHNNIGRMVGYDVRLPFIGRHRFHLAFENKRWRGYVTEKLPTAMAAGALPIYWGCPNIAREFNPKSFINASDFRTAEEACQRVLALDGDRDQLAGILREPWFHENRPNAAYDLQLLGDWLHWAIGTGKQPSQNLFPGAAVYKKYEILSGRMSAYLFKLRLGINKILPA